MLRVFIASLLAAAALCVIFTSGPRQQFQPVALVPSSYAPTTTYFEFPADPRAPEPVMAVPKKRTSKMKTRSRKANWYAKAERQAELAWNRAKSLKANPEDYMSSNSDDDDEDEEDEE